MFSLLTSAPRGIRFSIQDDGNNHCPGPLCILGHQSLLLFKVVNSIWALLSWNLARDYKSEKLSLTISLSPGALCSENFDHIGFTGLQCLLPEKPLGLYPAFLIVYLGAIVGVTYLVSIENTILYQLFPMSRKVVLHVFIQGFTWEGKSSPLIPPASGVEVSWDRWFLSI